MSESELLDILSRVKDPEIPVVDIVGLGIVRGVSCGDSEIVVQITPTYSGCPAMDVIRREIVEEFQKSGYDTVRIETVLAPPWTTDWISEDAKTSLREYGIAPPGPVEEEPLIPLPRRRATITCPFCGSQNTERKSEFGATACKALHYCHACQQPFEHFKAF
ncbi:MAG: phenylacetate-CoA oxygenase subunit PaaJ [Bdellovibrionales bacterium]|nr:phenylacetate-CoA oxygenase subunit PaaJ [Bdellovibrionales bacterium]